MSKKQEKIFVIAIIVLIVFSFLYLQESDTLLNSFLDQFSKVNWEEVKERDIVKNSIPIEMIKKKDESCKMSAQKFDLIVDHQYFIRGNELEQVLKFDRENKTIVIPCNMLEGDNSKTKCLVCNRGITYAFKEISVFYNALNLKHNE